MTPRDLKLWRLRLRTLKRDVIRVLGEQGATDACRAIDRIAARLAEEATPEVFQEVSVQRLAAAYKPHAQKGRS